MNRLQIRLAMGILAWISGLTGMALGATYLVTSTADSGPGTLRQAILDANAQAGKDTIAFDIASTPPLIIQPLTGLPSLRDSVIVDGTTQPGYAGIPLVVLDGILSGTQFSGLVINANQCVVRGLVVFQFPQSQIYIYKNENRIEGCYLGTDPTGSRIPEKVFTSAIYIQRGANNIIGGATPDCRNVLGGGSWATINISDNASAKGNRILGNYIGVNASGTAKLGGKYGIMIYNAPENVVGGLLPGERNIISGYEQVAVKIAHAESKRNRVLGNYVGTDPTGTVSIPNRFGIQIDGGAEYNEVGGAEPGAGNLASGNSGTTGDGTGISVEGASGGGNLIRGNRIGVDVSGRKALPNDYGVRLDYTTNQVVGGTQPGEGNIISANKKEGVFFIGSNCAHNTVQGNYIGATPQGDVLGNGGSGVILIYGPHDNLIGGLEPGARNIVANNRSSQGYIVRGVWVSTDAVNNTIWSNSIHSNGSVGIDLGGPGPTLNDPMDLDSGTNNLQNFPVLTAARSSTGTLIQGLFNSAPQQEFLLQFFWNHACDGLGYGEGQYYLGSIPVLTNADGDTSFTVIYHDVTIPTGKVITSTATDWQGNTSEFSACLAVSTGEVPTPTPTPTPSPSASPTPSLTPTETPTLTPSPTPSPSPTPAAGPRIDSDGDGYADWYESLPEVGTDPADPFSVPDLGDVNGSGRATQLDALLLYRFLLGQRPGDGLIAWDVDYDGDCDLADAMLLYRWAVRLPGYEILPHVQP